MALPLGPIIASAGRKIAATVGKKLLKNLATDAIDESLEGLQLDIRVDEPVILESLGKSLAFLNKTTQKRYWESVGDFEIQRAKGRINRGFDINNRPFVPLSPVTIRKKGNSRFLIDKGIMIRSFTRKARPDGVEILNNTQYATDQNEGNPQKNIPQRQFMGFSQKDLQRLIDNYAKGAIGIAPPINPTKS